MISVEALPIGEVCGYWDEKRVPGIGRGYTFMHPKTDILDHQAMGTLYKTAQENPNQLVAVQVSASDYGSNQAILDWREAVWNYLPTVWHPIEVQVAIRAIVLAHDGIIPSEMDSEIFDMMERV